MSLRKIDLEDILYLYKYLIYAIIKKKGNDEYEN